MITDWTDYVKQARHWMAEAERSGNSFHLQLAARKWKNASARAYEQGAAEHADLEQLRVDLIAAVKAAQSTAESPTV